MDQTQLLLFARASVPYTMKNAHGINKLIIIACFSRDTAFHFVMEWRPESPARRNRGLVYETKGHTCMQ